MYEDLIWRLRRYLDEDEVSEDLRYAADAIEQLQAELDRVKVPCKVGAIVRGKNGKWSGEVTELSVNSDGWFLYVDYGNGYRNYHRPDEVLF